MEGGEQFFFDMNGGRKSLRKHRVDGGGGSHHQPKRERVAGKEGALGFCHFFFTLKFVFIFSHLSRFVSCVFLFNNVVIYIIILL